MNPTSSTPKAPAIKIPNRLPSPPGVVLRILDLSRREDTQMYQIADVIKTDPALTARLLRFVNSPIMGTVREISSVHEAVILLGLRSTKLLTLGFSLLSPEFQPRCPGFDVKLFWEESLIRGVLARALAVHFFDTDGEQAFVAGLLSGIGRLALANVRPEDYSRVFEHTKGGISLLTAESQELGINHVQFGAQLLTDWQVPQVLVDAVARQVETEAPADGSQPLVQTVAIARQLAPMLLGNEKPDLKIAIADRGALHEVLECSQAKWDCFVEDVTQNHRTMGGLFDLSVDKQPAAIDVLIEAREEAIRIGLTAQIEQTQLSQNRDDLLHLATTDPLTGVANRARFNERLGEMISGVSRGLGQCALLLFDLDHFKEINDKHGHQTGDIVLKEVAGAVKRVLRDVDMAARYGGEEFAILLPGIDPQGACTVAERIRQSVADLQIRATGNAIRVTISVGVAFTGDYSEIPDAHQLVAEADSQLYLAKEAGRNTWYYRGQPASRTQPNARWKNLSQALARLGRRG